MADNFNDFTGNFDSDDISQNKVFAALAYIPMLFIIPLLAASGSKYAKFHANQGLILTIFAAVCAVVSKLIGFIIGWIPFLGGLVSWIVSGALGIAVVVYIITGIVNAVSGNAKMLPFIGNLLDIIK